LVGGLVGKSVETPVGAREGAYAGAPEGGIVGFEGISVGAEVGVNVKTWTELESYALVPATLTYIHTQK
jgi:hypothetical protein